MAYIFLLQFHILNDFLADSDPVIAQDVMVTTGNEKYYGMQALALHTQTYFSPSSGFLPSVKMTL